jgi:DNA repair photolyase
MNADEDFETKIIVKANMPDVLRQELARRSWTRERVAIGTATDAYQPCEGRYGLIRNPGDHYGILGSGSGGHQW